MKTQITLLLSCLVLISRAALAQTNAFTYQGRLNHGEGPANGLYEMSFGLFDAESNGNTIGTPMTVAPVPVTNGLFTVSLDFGANAFTGADRWLEISLTVFGSDQPVVTLAPRQPITTTPYAFTARRIVGPISATQLVGTLGEANLGSNYSRAVAFTNPGNVLAGNGAGLTQVNAATLNGLPSAAFWKTNGNAGANPTNGAFLGTVDNLPLELRVTGLRALRLEPTGDSNDGNLQADGAPNVIGGSPVNSAVQGAVGVTISGGGAMNFGGGASPNSVGSHYVAVGGGRGNMISSASEYSTIAGGSGNRIQNGSPSVTISGGSANSIESLASFSTVSGGDQNVIQVWCEYATIGGGGQNAIQTDSDYATINGGGMNTILPGAHSATIGGGQFNTISLSAGSATIGGGVSNTIETNSAGSTIGGGNLNLIRSNAVHATIAGGRLNTIQPFAVYAAIGGGTGNLIDSPFATVGGGFLNSIQSGALDATIAGGNQNTVQVGAWASAVGGGRENTILADAVYGTIPGGFQNSAANYAFAAGRQAKAIHAGAFVWADATAADLASTNVNSVTMRASGGFRLFTDSAATSGAELAPGSGSWSSLSDRNAKENFNPANAREILDKVTALPMASWNYKAQAAGVRHLGPTAQDFHAAFGLGESDRAIATVDADGVALAAIQGLNQKLMEELKRRDAEASALKQELAEIKDLLQGLALSKTTPQTP